MNAPTCTVCNRSMSLGLFEYKCNFCLEDKAKGFTAVPATFTTTVGVNNPAFRKWPKLMPATVPGVSGYVVGRGSPSDWHPEHQIISCYLAKVMPALVDKLKFLIAYSKSTPGVCWVVELTNGNEYHILEKDLPRIDEVEFE